MNIIVVRNDEAASDLAFERIKAGIEEGRIKTLGLATGGTPLKLYRRMREERLDVSGVVNVNLDEYIGLRSDDPCSFHYYMQQELYSHIAFKEVHNPDGMAENLEAECERYERVLAKHPVDLQILGLGTNGHIGFNEPGTSFHSRTQVVELTKETIEANKRYFANGQDVPTHAISTGISSIMEAKEIILMAFGESKAEAVKLMIEGPVTESCPASVLQTHPDATIILDEAAASKLSRKD